MIRLRKWHGGEQEEFGGAVFFEARDAISQLNTLRGSMNSVNKEMLAFTNRLKEFNASVGQASNLAKLVQLLEQTAAAEAKLATVTAQTSKATVDADEALAKYNGTLLNETKYLTAEGDLIKRTTQLRAQDASTITAQINAENQLVSVKERSVNTTNRQIEAEQRAAVNAANARALYATTQQQISSGMLTNIRRTEQFNNTNQKTQEIIRGVNDQGKNFTATFKYVNGALADGKTRLGDVNNQLRETDGLTKAVTLSWNTFARIVTVQVLHRAVSLLIAEMKEAVRTASEFQIKISEVRTIAQDAQLSTERWSEGLRKLSDSFGIDILTQTEAAYQTLSNQIAKGADAFKFLESANRLAIATVSNTDTAVKVLTAVMNSYSLSVDKAEKVSAALFKTVELGRLRLEDLTEIGNVSILANRLNVSFQELLTSIDVLSRQGVAADEAMTLLRNVMLALIRPTTDMKQLLRDMGAESGEAAIAQRGLAGVFAELERRTEGSTSALAEYFGRIRGIVGAAAFSGDKLRLFQEDLEKITFASQSFSNAIDIAFESAAKRINVEVNKIKNIFEKDIGEAVLEAIDDINTAIGGLANAIRTLVTVAGDMKSIFTSITQNFQQTFPGTAAAIDILGKAIKEYHSIISEATRIEDEMRRNEEEFEKALKDRTAAIERNIAKLEDTFDEQDRILRGSVANTRAEIYKIIDTQKELDKEIAENIKVAYGDVIKEIKKQISDLDKALKDSEKIIEGSAKRVRDIESEFSETIFELRFGAIEDPVKQVEVLKDRIAELQNFIKVNSKTLNEESIAIIRDAQKEIRERTLEINKITSDANKEALEQQKELLKLQEKKKQSEQDIAKINRQRSDKDLELQRKLQDAIKKAKVPTQIRRVGEEITVQGGDEKVAEAYRNLTRYREESSLRLQREKEDLAEIKKQISEVTIIKVEELDTQKELNKLKEQQIAIEREISSQALSRYIEDAKQKAKAEASLKRVEDAYRAINDIQLKGILKPDDITEQTKKAQDELAKIQDFAKIIQEEGGVLGLETSSKLLSEIAKRSEQLNVVIRENDRLAKLKALDEEITKRRDLQNQVTAEQKKAQEELQILQLRGTQVLREQYNKLATEFTTEIENSYMKLLRGTAPKQEATNLIAEQRKILEQYIANPTIENYKSLERALKNIPTYFSGAFKAPSFEALQQDMKRFLENTQAAQQAEANFNEQFLKVQNDLKQYQEEQKKLQTATEQRDSKRNDLLQQSTNYLKEMNEKIALAAQPQPIPKQHGGIAHGPDRIPALLTPGEFVVNAKASRQFYSQLVAMNSGTYPFSSGGSTTNVGDIKINMTSSGNESYDVVKLGKLLRREVRRGTLRF